MRNTQIEELLRIGVSALIVFGTIMLGVGEQSAVLTLCTLVAIAVSIYLTDVRKSFVLSQNLANFIAVGVMVVSAANVLYFDRAGQIGAVARLQSYMQYVLLFQPKTPRVYWQLALLSLGQVAIAATLVAGPLFGGMLLVYLLLGVATFTMLLLHTEAVRYALPLGAAKNGATSLPTLGDQAPRLLGSVAATPQRLATGLTEQVVGVLAATIAVTMVLFFIIPRSDTDSREAEIDESLHTVGFSKTITLGELGEVVQNPDVVMRIEFYHGWSSQPFKLAEEPLFRGSVVTRYDNGAWTQEHTGGTMPLRVRHPGIFVRQRISVEPMDVSELFCVVPVFALQPDSQLKLDSNIGQLMRHEEYRARHLAFEVGTTGIVGDRCRKFVPSESLTSSQRERLLQMPEADNDGRDPFAGLKETATQVLSERNIEPANALAAARALHEYLRHSGQYTYSLEWQPRTRNMDPLEDFVTAHCAGHCEYFAGALVMMLRSQGIPARMAIGFKGGEWNAVGGYYQVQQLHAHAWVEAHIDGEHIAPGSFSDADPLPSAGWLVLDPTVSSAESDAANQRAGLWARLRQSVDYARVLWSNYVVGLNSKRQQQGIYDPIQATARSAFDAVFSRDAWRQRGKSIARSPLGAFWEWYRRHWFSWRGGMVAAGASAMLVAVYFALRRMSAAAARWRRAWSQRHRNEPPPLEMYRRLEAALARRGFQRPPGQTSHEFAVAVGGHLAESVELNRVSHLPRRIVEFFYRVRFGRRTLDNHELEALEHALGELERTLGRKPR